MFPHTKPHLGSGLWAEQIKKRCKMALKRVPALATFLVSAAAPVATASATTLTLDTVTSAGAVYEFSYSATLGGDEGLKVGSRLVIRISAITSRGRCPPVYTRLISQLRLN